MHAHRAAAAVQPCAATHRGGSMADRAFQAERCRCLAEYSICRKRLKRLGRNCSLTHTSRSATSPSFPRLVIAVRDRSSRLLPSPSQLSWPLCVQGGDVNSNTGNGFIGRTGRSGQCGPFVPLFHFLCDILRPHPVVTEWTEST